MEGIDALERLITSLLCSLQYTKSIKQPLRFQEFPATGHLISLISMLK